MYLEILNFYNFRKFKQNGTQPGLTAIFNKNLNLIIGENDSGKTAIIDGIRYLLGSVSEDYEKISSEDFYCAVGGEFADEFTIEGIFKGLNEQEAGLFLEWLSFDTEHNYELRVVLKVERKISETGKEYFERRLMAGEENCEFRLNSQAKEVLKTTYLKPLRDANTELKSGIKSRLANILKAHSMFKGEKSQELVQVMIEANNKIESYFEEDYKDGRSLVKDIENILQDFYDTNDSNKSKTKFNISRVDLNSILRKLNLNTEEINLGLGNQNLLFIATELLLLNEFSSPEEVIGPNITLIEEIEAHLHTQAQIRLIKYLEAELEKNDYSRQFILTTHSSDLVSSVNPKNIVMIHNNFSYPMDEKYTCLATDDYKFLERFLDSTKCNLFFAKGLIFVEGESEMLLIPAIAELIGLPLHKYGVSLVNVHGTSFERYIKLFSRSEYWKKDLNLPSLNIPISIITDVDVKPYIYYQKEEPKDIYSIKNESNLDMILKLTKQVKEDINLENIQEEYSSVNKLFENLGLKGSNSIKNQCEPLLKIDITPDYIERVNKEKKEKIIKKYAEYNCNVKVNVAPVWTLEYCLANSFLRIPLYRTIHNNRYKNPFLGERNEEFETFKKQIKDNKLSREEIAYEIFKPVHKKLVSKAEVAQQLSSDLIEYKKTHSTDLAEIKRIKTRISSDSYLSYLVKAIEFATSHNTTATVEKMEQEDEVNE